MFVPKKFGSTKNFGQKMFGQKKIQKKNFGSKKCLLKTLWVKKNVGQ